jgi:prepilin-type N-terminal cleavage/methylation domain-containing protein
VRRLTGARRGFTLVEILVALVAFGIVAAILMRTLVMGQRVTTQQTLRAQMQSNLRVASFVVPNELRMLNQAATTDILSVSDNEIIYLAMRGYYMLCAVPTTATSIKVARVTTQNFSFDYRAPAAGDSAFVFYENDTLKMSDDAWIPVAISTVATGATCSHPASSPPTGLTFSLSGSGITGVLDRYLPGAPVRTYEITRLAEFTSGGEQYLGMCTGSTTCALEPVVGPLAPSNGFLLTRYDDQGAVVTGNTTANRNSLRSLKVRFIAKTAAAVSRGTDRSDRSIIYDTLTTQVTLRNVKQN